MIYEFKIALIGSAGSGKTSIIKRLFSDEFNNKYIATLETEVKPIIMFCTNNHIIQFNIWDCPEKEQPFKCGYINASACIGVIENGNKRSVSYLQKELKDKLLSNIPIFTALNKTKTRPIDNIDAFPDAIHVSAKYGNNLYELFLNIARQLTGLNDLDFICTINP